MSSFLEDIQRELLYNSSELAQIQTNLAKRYSTEEKITLDKDIENVKTRLLGIEGKLKETASPLGELKSNSQIGPLVMEFHNQLEKLQSIQRTFRERTIQEKSHLHLKPNFEPDSIEVNDVSSPLLSTENPQNQVIHDQLNFLTEEITLNDSIIQERTEGIREIQRAIYDVNEIFRDLGILVGEQGNLLGKIEDNIENAASGTRDAVRELGQANERRKARSWTLLKIILALIVIIFIMSMVMSV